MHNTDGFHEETANHMHRHMISGPDSLRHIVNVLFLFPPWYPTVTLIYK